MIYNAVYFSEYLRSYTGNDTTLPFLFRHATVSSSLSTFRFQKLSNKDQFLNDALTNFLYGSS